MERGKPGRAGIGVERLRLSHFRNYSELDVALGPGFNVLSGPNAHGKTNLLEALYLLSTTRLLRGRRDVEAIQVGFSQAELSADLLRDRTKVGMTLAAGTKKRVTVNGMGFPRAADVIGRVPTVCVSAADMALARGEPADRRLFLDLELSGLYPSYLQAFAHYKRALDQRNALLRADEPPHGSVFEPWEDQLARNGASIRIARLEYLREFAPLAAKIHSDMGDGEPLSVAYSPKDDAVEYEDLLSRLAESRALDAHRGGTTVGPHRDDVAINVDDREARFFGSQGQQRTAVVSMKLASLEFAGKALGSPPLLLLDDILSDLDEGRRHRLIELVFERADQAVLTCTEEKAAGERILTCAKLFHVRNGTVAQS